MSQSCNNCSSYRQGRCHRHAPRPVPVGTSALAIWPEVRPGDWCGDWAEQSHDLEIVDD